MARKCHSGVQCISKLCRRPMRIDYDAMIPDTSGRPVPLIPDGTPIRELL